MLVKKYVTFAIKCYDKYANCNKYRKVKDDCHFTGKYAVTQFKIQGN